jgi:hypothetical protein
MKDPERLLDHGATSEELRLLRAGVVEEPGVEGKKRLAAALGLGVGAWSATSTASAATKAASEGAASTSVASAIGAGTKLGGKWLIVLAGGISVSAVTLVATLGGPDSSTESARVHAPSTAPAPVASAASKEPAAEEATEQAALEPALPSEAPKSAPSSRRGTTSAPSTSADAASIAREIALLDEARTLVARGQSSAALGALSNYRKEFSRGVLRQEATLLQIEALAKSGNLAAAREIGQRFLREHPRTPHEKRVRALLGDAP